MFERYTEKARRVIFFARYEASQFGSRSIETEHLLLGVLREDKALLDHFLPSAASVESIRGQIQAHTEIRKKISTSVDLPLSHECKRVLAYGAEEAERMQHLQIAPSHLLLGLMRESGSTAAQMLTSRGLNLAGMRADILSGQGSVESRSPRPAEMVELARKQAADAGDGALETTHLLAAALDIFSHPSSEEGALRKRIRRLTRKMENAIASHDFQAARRYSEEERQVREQLRTLTGAPASGDDATEFIMDAAALDLVQQIFGSSEAPEAIRRRIAPRPPRREKIAPADIPLTEESKRALARADQERERLKDDIVSPFHLLLGLLYEESCEAAEILRSHGVSLEKTRAALDLYPPPPEEGTNYV